jgi:hypothetical protein
MRDRRDKKEMRTRTAMLFLLGGLLAALPLSAGSIGPSCGSCFGGVYTINVTAAGGNLYDVELTADLRTSTLDNDVWVRGVSVKGSEGALTSGSLTSTTATGTWTGSANAIAVANASGCQSAPGSGSVCATTANQLNLVNTVSSLWTWIFRIETANLKTDELPFHVQFAKLNGAGTRVRNAGIVSEAITVSTPEGSMSEIPLLLSGLVGVWFWNRRRMQRAAA